MNLFTKQKQTYRHKKQTYGYQRGRGESDKLGVWDYQIKTTIYKIDTTALNQDGGVEGHALTPSCENTRITTSCWTGIDRKTLELTKKDTPHPKTKEKPQ